MSPLVKQARDRAVVLDELLLSTRRRIVTYGSEEAEDITGDAEFKEDKEGYYVEFSGKVYRNTPQKQVLITGCASSVAVADWNGDGLTDVRSKIVNGQGVNHYNIASTSLLGPYISRALARAPDLLVGVTNGLGATASWAHQPLSQRDSVPNCDMPPGEKFYVAHQDATGQAPGYVYFTSSMWTVARFEASNGLGAATNRTCYRYQDAMLNTEGLGLQGFKVIVAEEQLSPAAGEDATAGYPGCGGTCSPRWSRLL